MSEAWSLSEMPSDSYLRWSQGGQRLFALPAWSLALESLGATGLFAWHAPRAIGALVAVFQRGPVRIGVLGFPVAGASFDALDALELDALARDLCISARLDLLRINTSMRKVLGSTATSARPDAWIDDLSKWDISTSRRLRKDLAFARRANPELRISTQFVEPDACHAMYAATVRAQGGRLRYTPAYFHTLARISDSTPLLKPFCAIDADGGLRGFAIMALDADCAYYLHGGSDDKGRREGVSDLLIEAMLKAAAGCSRFNLMSSPWAQPGLLRFKRKWSNHEGLAVTFDISASLIGEGARRLLRWRARHDRSQARASATV